MHRRQLIKSEESRNFVIGIICSILMVALLCVAQIIANKIIIFLCLASFLVFTLWACSKDLALPVLMFYLPWSPLLKMQVGGMTFFTFALVAITLFMSVKKGAKFRLNYIFIGIALLIITLISKQIDGNTISAGYILFIFLLIFFPLVVSDDNICDDFYLLTVFFALGIITAALSAQFLDGFSNISRFITVDKYLQITRRSGFYGDPNFYSAHITACIAAILLLLLHEKKKSRRALLIVCLPIMIYCGIISASKSFVIVFIICIMIWVVMILLTRRSRGSKVAALLFVIIIIAMILSAGVFKDLIQVLNLRFSFNSSFSDITTGRTDLWKMYLKEISSDLKVFLIGKGFTNVKLSGRGSHNSLIQSIFQFGVIGTFFLISWFVMLYRNIIPNKSKEKRDVGTILILYIGSLLPWMALDILFFDELFLIPTFVFIGFKYLRQNCDVVQTINT